MDLAPNTGRHTNLLVQVEHRTGEDAKENGGHL
jgi:hypothetical protein